MKKSEESNSPSPSLASFTMNSESDLSDSDQINSVAHPTRLNFLEVKTDEDGSDYDDVPFPCSSTSDNGFDGFRARSQTMTERTPLFQLKKQKFTEVSEYNNEPERDETVLYVQKNSRMIVVYRLKTKTPSDEYLKKLVSFNRFNTSKFSMTFFIIVVNNDDKTTGFGWTDLHDL